MPGPLSEPPHTETKSIETLITKFLQSNTDTQAESYLPKIVLSLCFHPSNQTRKAWVTQKDQLKNKADQSNPRAQVLLGLVYLFGGVVSPAPLISQYYLLNVTGFWKSYKNFVKGYIYHRGLCGLVDEAVAFDAYMKAIKPYNDGTQTQSYKPQQDDGELFDIDQSDTVTSIFLNARNHFALIELGDFYRHGLGDQSINYNNAMSCYRRAGKLSHPMGKMRLGEMYHYGLYYRTDHLTAQWYYYPNAIDHGAYQAFRHLGDLFRTHPMLDLTERKTFQHHYYLQSARWGDFFALSQLGQWFQENISYPELPGLDKSAAYINLNQPEASKYSRTHILLGMFKLSLMHHIPVTIESGNQCFELLRLKQLNLTRLLNDIDTSTLETISKKIKSYSVEITSLSLNNNLLQRQISQFVNKSLLSPKLKRLDLTGNHLNGKAWYQLWHGLNYLTQWLTSDHGQGLRLLQLTRCGLTDTDILLLVKSLSAQSIRWVDVSQNLDLTNKAYDIVASSHLRHCTWYWTDNIRMTPSHIVSTGYRSKYLRYIYQPKTLTDLVLIKTHKGNAPQLPSSVFQIAKTAFPLGYNSLRYDELTHYNYPQNLDHMLR